MKKPVVKKSVRIFLKGIQIEGFVSVSEGLRVSDFLNNDANIFVSVVDAKIYDWKEDFIQKQEYIAVNKDKIHYLIEQ